MTPSCGSSNGRLDIWWDARSDWNANGEKAIFAGVMYDLGGWDLDLFYTIQQGRAKDTLFKLHFTRYNNHSNLSSYGGGYGNIFQDKKEVKFIVIAPFTVFLTHAGSVKGKKNRCLSTGFDFTA
ncbi:hypothetical protein B1H58_01205 [Pantoea alhagi]|uniref:Porin n=1 Tax=Pantoea alhagi TaxID=1891675 RepID=A0A1W6B0Y4_9GAMM|nr:hypothetical protein B1H58_01205 [Pantoea alhagi]